MAELTYRQLRKSVAALEKTVARDAEAIRKRAKQIDEEAQDTAKVAEMIGGMRVDKATVSETRDLSRIMSGLSQAAIAYAAAGDTTAKSAKAAGDQARTTHGGIQEAVSRSNVDGIHDVNREWLRQE